MLLNERVATYIEQEGLLDPGQRVVVGVSGGPDSLCLLHCLLQGGFRPLVAHFDHGLRPESVEDAEFVRKTAEALGVPFHLGVGKDLPRESSIEEVARIQRYQFLASVASGEGASRLAVGHTANDQAETVLMHLIRGAGPNGLRGMLPKSVLGSWAGLEAAPGVLLIRPLLEIWRHETTAFCREHGLEARSDVSNQDVRFFRNRLRNELLPELESYNPRMQEVLVRTAKVMAAEAKALDSLLDEEWTNWASAAGENALRLNAGALSSAPLALQRGAIRRAILRLAPELRDISFETVERALEAMRAGRRISITGGLELLSMNGDAILMRPGAEIEVGGYPRLISTEPVVLRIPGELKLQGGWAIDARETKPQFEFPPSHDEAWFDSSELMGGLEVRPISSGDRIAPLGMTGSMKVSDLFINRKVPRMARTAWPLVVSGDRIIWIPGLHRFNGGKVTRKTESMLKMRLLRPAGLSDEGS